jgi:hypothetical protein
VINASDSDCQETVSDTARAIISPDLLVTVEPTNINECVGGTDQMTVVVTGGSGAITYQWQESINGVTGWVNATGMGAVTNTFTPPSVTPGTLYYRVIINAANSDCQQAISDTARAIIAPDLVSVVEPSNVNECVGGTDQMNVVVTGGSGTVTYQWQSSANGNEPWANASGLGSTTNTFTPPSNTPGVTYYRVIVNASNSGCQESISSIAIATISPEISITSEPTNVNECVGGTDHMSVVVTGGSGAITYQWQSSTTGAAPWSNATGLGSTTNTFTPPSATPGTSSSTG